MSDDYKTDNSDRNLPLNRKPIKYVLEETLVTYYLSRMHVEGWGGNPAGKMLALQVWVPDFDVSEFMLKKKK